MAELTQSKEEAWAALPEGAKLNARTLAVAVVKEALGDCQSVPCGQVQWDRSIYRCSRCRKVAQVEALGHKDDEVRGSVEWDIFMRKRCPDCQVQPGQAHNGECDIEQCSVCGWQKLQCDCAEHDPAFARWSGFWPGKLEALALGVDLNTLAASGIHAVLMMKPVT